MTAKNNWFVACAVLHDRKEQTDHLGLTFHQQLASIRVIEVARKPGKPVVRKNTITMTRTFDLID